MLGLLKIYKQSPGGCDSEREAVYRKTFQGIDPELFLQLLDR